MPPLLDLGLIPFDRYLVVARTLAAARAAGEIPDFLLMAVHPPVITLGTQAKPTEFRWDEAALDAAGLQRVRIERGGATTYHGPDQQMLYPVRRLEMGEVHAFVRQLQEVVVLAAAAMGVAAFRREGYPGVWTEKGKLASLGIAVKRQVTLHGIALNCEQATSGGFEAIIPCGLTDVVMTDLASETGMTLSRFAVRGALATGWETVFGERVEMGSPDLFPAAIRDLLVPVPTGNWHG